MLVDGKDFEDTQCHGEDFDDQPEEGSRAPEALQDVATTSSLVLHTLWCQLAIVFFRQHLCASGLDSIAFTFKRHQGDDAVERKPAFQSVVDFIAPAASLPEFEFCIEDEAVHQPDSHGLAFGTSSHVIFTIVDAHPTRIKGAAGRGTQHGWELDSSLVAVATHRLIHTESDDLGVKWLIDGRPGSGPGAGGEQRLQLESDLVGNEFLLLEALGRQNLSSMQMMYFKPSLVYNIQSITNEFLTQSMLDCLRCLATRHPQEFELTDDKTDSASGLRLSLNKLVGGKGLIMQVSKGPKASVVLGPLAARLGGW